LLRDRVPSADRERTVHSPERDQGRGGERAVVSDVHALIQGFSTYLQAIKLSKRTVEEYTKDIRRWSEWFQRPVEFFNQDEWDDYAAHLDRAGVDGRSVRRYQASLKRFFKYLRRRKLVSHDPALDCEQIRVSKKLPVWLTESEVNALIDSAEDAKFRAMFELMYSCGLRNEEARSLRLHQVSQTFIQLYGKGNKERVVALKGQSRAVLDAWLKERPESEFVFPSLSDKGYVCASFLKLAFRAALKKAGILKPATPHSLRHSIATHLAVRGVTAEKLQVFLGHERIETTMIYVHLAKQLSEQAILLAHPRA